MNIKTPHDTEDSLGLNTELLLVTAKCYFLNVNATNLLSKFISCDNYRCVFRLDIKPFQTIVTFMRRDKHKNTRTFTLVSN